MIRYAVAIPLAVTASPAQVRTARDTARGRAHALAACFASYTEHNYYTRHRLARPATVLAGRRLDNGDLLSVPELAALAHLPTDDAIPGVARAGAKALAPPPGIATPGPGAKPLGVTDSGHPRPVALRVSDARHHLHVLGATGSGKSTLLAQMILADADAGRGIVLIDPKGDLVTDVLSRLPRSAADRLVLIDADSRARPPCLNPLDGGDTDLIVDNLVSVFRRVYSAFWGPRTDDVMRAACLTLRAQHGVATLAEVPKLLTDVAFRSRVTAAVTDPVLQGFWSWYDELTDSGRAQVISPLMNKLRAFLLRPFVRDALAAGRCHRGPRGGARRRYLPGAHPERLARGGDHPPDRLPGGGPGLAGHHRPRPHPTTPTPRRPPGDRRMPQLPAPALPDRGHARRSPRIPPRDDPGPPAPRPTVPRTPRRHLHQRPQQDLLHRQPGRRPRPGPPHQHPDSPSTTSPTSAFTTPRCAWCFTVNKPSPSR